MSTKRNTVKQWFKNFLKPTQTQFWTLFDNIWFKDEDIPVSQIDGINELLDTRANTETLNNHLNDTTVHITPETSTSQFVNNGADGVNSFISLKDVPEYTLSEIDINNEVSLLKEGEIITTLNLTKNCGKKQVKIT